MVISDICNTLADVNGYLHRVFEVPRGVYPAPIPKGFWPSGTGLMVFQKADPIPGAVECLRGLSEKLGGLAYATCRPRDAELVTKRWLKLHGFPDGPVFFCADAREKLAVAQKLGAALALDDDPEAIRLYARSGIAVLYPDWPYNRSLDEPNAVRVAGVMEVGYGC
ncbi:MAG: hypothetical protein C4575_06930 [Desulforudis sp.]|nr:MAG: hypothetical protein C4575_06930 [Desulforudis sp.]